MIHLPRFTGANSLSKTILLRNHTQHWFKYTPLHAFSNMSLLLPFIIQFPFDHSFANDKIFLQSPLDMVDLDSDAVDIAQRLGRLSHFLSGAKGLLTCSFLSPNEFHRYSRKIVCLIEVARKTLTAAQILPYSSFRRASPFYLHKSAYLDLLKMLYDRRHHVDAALQDRLVRLFQPLAFDDPKVKGVGSSDIVTAERSSVAFPEGRLERLATASMQRPLKRLHSKFSTRTTSECDTLLMPPPDNFSEADTKHMSLASAKCRSSQQLWDPDVMFSASMNRQRRKSLLSENNVQENTLIDTEPPRGFRPRPLSRRFGIYCTKNGTMNRQNERGGRLGSTSSAIKE